ncbi:hypothetical protein [Clostridium cochlearium]|jgi:hypothetical protein|uniref:Uncharacterized protein n=1 Tax=Clostridium cochlearium TaxID=1494 RepID=A0A2X2W923_CLOCO|nr:hypothetical protein [Clostridium cochlearium]SQB34163.1 Uncharacterised protein [Clostridium cochlearium]
MDYSLLDEHLEKMEPYFKKWIREYNIMLLDSSLESAKYEVSIDATFNPKDAICQQYMYSIYNAFRELVRTYCYSTSAYSIEKELRDKEEIAWSNYWKYEIKNYYFRSIIPRYFSILDYIAVMINEISKQKLIPNIRIVDFKKMMDKLVSLKDMESVGWLTEKDIKEIKEIFNDIQSSITSEERKILRDYRNKETHRYLIGIDEITVSTHKRRLTKKEKELYKLKGDYAYSFKGKPEIEFSKLNTIVEKLINNLDLVISKLLELDIMKNVLVIRKDD